MLGFLNFTKFALALTIALAGSAVSAAEVDWVTKGRQSFLQIRGVIQPGDYQKVVRLLGDDRAEGFLLNGRVVDVESPGGSVDEAMKLGRLFRDLYAKINVYRQCSSACFFLYVGAVDRFPLGQIGLHNPYLDARSANQLSIPTLEAELRRAEIATRDFLKEFAVPSYLVERMFSRTSVETYKLTSEDKFAVGLIAVGWGQVRVSKCGARPDLERQFMSDPLSYSPLATTEYGQYRTKVRECENALLGPTVVQAALDHFNREMYPTKR
jgi:hypothetical protein